MKLPILVLLFASYGAHAQNLSKELDIEVFSSRNTTAVVQGKQMYVKTFELSILDTSGKPVELTKENGCLMAEGKNGSKLSPSRIAMSLLGNLESNHSKEGSITFMSDSKQIYDTEFVFWDDYCGK